MNDDLLGTTNAPPPIGLRPESIFEMHRNTDRIREILAAMRRYGAVEKPMPVEWLAELERRVELALRHPQ